VHSVNFFEQPILNSPYEYPGQHWELDESRQPTNQVTPRRRPCDLITPVPTPRKKRGKQAQAALDLAAEAEISDSKQKYDPMPIINALRTEVDTWRKLPNANQWQVTPETARLLQHWRHHDFHSIRPFFCQLEAVETAIWLAEVAPKNKGKYKHFLDHLAGANEDANPELFRIALKLATGAGKTTVMAMLMAWQTINAVRHPQSKQFSRGFLIIAPGITIKDRLRVLQPNDPDSYYKSRELVPDDLLPELGRAAIVITNYHAFKYRTRFDISKTGKALLKGHGEDINTLETPGQMIKRVMPELMGLKKIVVINDEAHHCYREKPESDEDAPATTGTDADEIKQNKEAARLWITGIEDVKKKLGVQVVYDLSATPFFLAGSGYVEGTLFPWTMCDFSLMDAIECGIVKLPRVPVADNIQNEEMPMYRNLWEHIGKDMPKKGRGKKLDPFSLPTPLYTAIDALYGHYKKTYEAWQQAGISVPPVFIIVCNNTATSKLIYEYIAGFEYEPDEKGDQRAAHTGKLPLFSNYDEHSQPRPRPNTLLIDSAQLESGEALDKNFRDMADTEIALFKRQMKERGDHSGAENISDADLLREVMNTVGKPGRLGESVRCVVSVSMLTEGWDANTVTHVLGVRAFGTQLLCEQVVGRALRRWSYELNEQQLFDVEYADVLGIPFDFTAKPQVVKPKPPKKTENIHAIKPERDHLEIVFPRVTGYRIDLPKERLRAEFDHTAELRITPADIGATKVQQAGIIGESEELSVEHLNDERHSSIIFRLTNYLLQREFRDAGEAPKMHLFGQLKRIVRQWLDGGYLVCVGGTTPAQVLYREMADRACQRIRAGITTAMSDQQPIVAILDPYNPVGSTSQVSFNSSRDTRDTIGPPPKNHINKVVLDSDWEDEFCRILEAHPKVIAYTKNQNLGLEVPYVMGSEARHYLPDFILKIDSGEPDHPLNLIVEVKGYRGADAVEKAHTMQHQWVPGVNQLRQHGRWAFAEFTRIFEMQDDFEQKLTAELDQHIQQALADSRVTSSSSASADHPQAQASTHTESHAT